MKVYTVNIGGLEHTVQLSEEDAKRLGAKVVETPSKAASAAANKARVAPNKAV